MQTLRTPRVMPPGALWKYNVAPKYLEAVVEHQMFGENGKHNVQVGDLILLQELKTQALDAHARVRYALEVASYEPDLGNESDAAWGVHFNYLIKGRVYEVPEPFSLEDLGLSRSYSKQGAQSPERIRPEDEAAVEEAMRELSQPPAP